MLPFWRIDFDGLVIFTKGDVPIEDEAAMLYLFESSVPRIDFWEPL